MEDLRIINEFANRERKVTIAVLVAFVIFGGVIAINYFADIYINPAIPFFVGLAICITGFYKWYRCPKCNSVPRALGRAGVQISPHYCGECGAKLR